MEKTSVEGIAATRRIHRANTDGFDSQDLPVANSQRAGRTKFNNRNTNPASQLLGRGLDTPVTGDGLRFSLIWKDKLELFQQRRQPW